MHDTKTPNVSQQLQLLIEELAAALSEEGSLIAPVAIVGHHRLVPGPTVALV
jgi:hypothetical protein